MNRRTPPKAPQTTDELAALMFAPSRNTTRLETGHRPTEHDDATARAFFGLPPLTLDDDADED